MRRKLVYLISFAIVLSAAGAASADLVGHWRFDEGSGTIANDTSGNGNHGTLNGGPKWVVGYFGGALEFDGTDDWIDCGSDPSLDLTTWTVAFWLNVNQNKNYNGFVIKGLDAAENYEVLGFADGSFHFPITHTDGSRTYVNSSAGVIVEGEWAHYAYAYDPAEGRRLYKNGSLVFEDAESRTPQASTTSLAIGNEQPMSRYVNGIMDDVRIYNSSLTEPEILAVMEGAEGYPYALGANPEDGALLAATWASLSWTAGSFAVSHDVYLGDNFDDVNNGTGETFIGNQTATTLIIGFTGFPYPDGLVPGTTYYWRIDEVNDADPNSPWKGNVWSFSVPPRTAYDPVPAEGAKFIDPQPTLSWTPGFGAKLHTVYFGGSFDEVDAATGGTAQAFTTFTPPGPLEPEETYFWRVDEFDVTATHKGPVWNFEVAREGGGVKGQYFQGMGFNSLALTRTDPQIDFSWGNNEPDPVVGADNFSCRWTGQVEAAFTETYTFYTNSDDGVRLWVGGKRLVNNWTDHSNTENKGKIDLVAGHVYSVVMEMYENTGGAVAQLRWESPSTPKQLIPAAALSYLTNANIPKPANGTVGVKLQSALTWSPGEYAASHEVYFGTDADAVANATKASPEYKGSKALGAESLDPGMLAFDTEYFWRVDEVNNTNPDSPWVGSVWSFSTGPFLVVDDFEAYDDIDPLPGETANRIFDKWIDGFGTLTNGALVGNDLPPYAEQTIVNSGTQSMIYRYDNAGKTSEATLTLVWPRDWTAEGVTKLSLWVRGSSTNAADRIFVALNGTAVVYHDDTAATQKGGWNEWVVDLSAFGVNRTNVNSITIGVGTKNAPSPGGGTGTLYFDDIRLVR